MFNLKTQLLSLVVVCALALSVGCYDSGDSNDLSSSTGAANLEPYYADASGLSGLALKAKLHEIINRGVVRFTYTQCWDEIKYIHEDPGNSSNIILIYTGYSIPKAYMASGVTYNYYWNREHVWAQSHGEFDTVEGAGTDLHHLMPCDVSLNGSRGNLDFDNGGIDEPDTTPTEGYSTSTGCKKDSNSFEPRDQDKGDIARMLFYMAVMYDNKNTSSKDTIDLELNDLANGSQSTSPAYHGFLTTLKAWNNADPVDEWEKRRNDRTYDRQGNRNPFIDHPEWVSSIWGS